MRSHEQHGEKFGRVAALKEKKQASSCFHSKVRVNILPGQVTLINISIQSLLLPPTWPIQLLQQLLRPRHIRHTERHTLVP